MRIQVSTTWHGIKAWAIGVTLHAAKLWQHNRHSPMWIAKLHLLTFTISIKVFGGRPAVKLSPSRDNSWSGDSDWDGIAPVMHPLDDGEAEIPVKKLEPITDE